MSRRRVAIVFDLTPDMPFRLTDGTTVNLGELERMVRLAPGHRLCAVGPESRTATRVRANMSSHGLALYDVKTRVSHRWAHKAPPDLSEFREALKALFADSEFRDAETDLDEDTARALRVAGHAGASRRRGTAAQGHGGAIMTNPRSQTNWQIPQELPDLRRVGTVALDTEDERRGPARRSRIVLAVARRSCCRHQRRLARGRRDACDLHTLAPSRHRQFRSRSGLSLAQGSGRIRRPHRHP